MASTHEYEVTLSIYSGRRDPSWKIHSSDPSLKKIKEHHENVKSRNVTYHHDQVAAKLGYRGFLVLHKDSEHPELIVGPETIEFQKTLLDTMPSEMKTTSDFHQSILQNINTSVAPSEPTVSTPAPSAVRSTSDAPDLDLQKWNSDLYIQRNNNCYNYGNDKITKSFAQPGRGSGQMYHSISAEEIKAASMRDGLEMLQPQPGPNDASPSTDKAPSGRWIVALVVAFHQDFHWYRLDSNEYWSHKPGGTKATRYDGDDNLITDPRKAANSSIPYKFVAFMTTSKDVKIE